MKQGLPTLTHLLIDPQQPFIHRDLSWIQFNDRVLAEAFESNNPYLKRLKFLGISSTNLDEFFMIRFASLLRSLQSTKDPVAKERLERIKYWILESVRKFTLKQQRCLKIQHNKKGKIIVCLKPVKASKEFSIGKEVFEKKILPKLQQKNNFQLSQLLDLKNLQLLVFVDNSITYEIDQSLEQCYSHYDKITDTTYIFFLDDLLLSHLDAMLPIKTKPGILRLTRDADFTADLSEHDTESIPDIIRTSLQSREKGKFVRMQYHGSWPQGMIDNLSTYLKILPNQCFRTPGTFCLGGLFPIAQDLSEIFAKDPSYCNPPLQTVVPTPFRAKNIVTIFDSLAKFDFILHQPYDSFLSYIAWLKQAAEDPKVISIEQTIYRTDSVSKIVEILKEAAKTKKVTVTLELRARFDEWNNLKIADELTKAGVTVKFGFGNLKLHAKVTLITRLENNKKILYTHLSTGNYNSKTSRLYTDFSLFTANSEIGEDAKHFFDSVYRKHIPSSFKKLLIAPTKLHSKLRALVKDETDAATKGETARIFAKVNSLVDQKLIEDLYRASQAGVKIDLVVRGACSLVPGVSGLSENIRVISIVDRLLEHSRIYYFAHSKSLYLSSADWMPRNFFSRLEIAFPVLDNAIFNYVESVVIPGYLKDNSKAKYLDKNGLWKKPPKSKEQHRSQEFFETLAVNRYKGTPLDKRNLSTLNDQTS
ncbi:MAG: polyphosphate kinase 1 [Oligoflexia bacterium]|nr:polyphosphate kinase 1 [Oligoflexia bacterium]